MIFTPVIAEPVTVVRVHPSFVTLSAGERTTIEIWVDDVSDLVAFSVKLTFDPTRLSADSLQPGNFVDFFLPEPSNGIDNDSGVIMYGYSRGSDSDPAQGSGVLFSFRITAKNVLGETELQIETADLVHEDISLIPNTVNHGRIDIIEKEEEDCLVFLPLVLR